MSKAKNSILETINSLNSINETDREMLLKSMKLLDKEHAIFLFKIGRLHKDKLIAQDILNATISDLESKKEKLEQSYKELEQFSYIASHDLKSPLRTIGNFAQLLKRRYYDSLDSDANEFIDFIVSGVAQMNDVIIHSLEFAKVGRDDLEFEPTDLNKIVDIVLLHLQDEIETNQASIVFNNLPTIKAHKISLIQLFQNLISNAIKYKQLDAPPRIIITSESSENYWKINVKDNGIGIDEAYKEKIFQPFKRINELNRPGSGIGLAICKKIAYLHHGDITFESKIGQGSTFTITFKKII